MPPLHVADIDRETLRDLFSDVELLGEGLHVVVKRAREQHTGAGDVVSLADGVTMLLSGAAVGAQLRYRFQGKSWWDTLIATEAGFRLVRIQQGATLAGSEG